MLRSVDVVYEGFVLAQGVEVRPEGEDGPQAFVPLAAPMPVGTRLELRVVAPEARPGSPGLPVLPVRVARVRESGESGVFIGSVEEGPLDLSALHAPEPEEAAPVLPLSEMQTMPLRRDAAPVDADAVSTEAPARETASEPTTAGDPAPVEGKRGRRKTTQSRAVVAEDDGAGREGGRGGKSRS